MQTYFEFEVSLRHIKPRIWRRFLIAANATFGDLHRAIQDSFGWMRCHLWEFRASRRRVLAGLKQDDFGDFGFGQTVPDAETVKLGTHFARSNSCQYIYDFGDDWLHDVKRNRRVRLADSFHRQLLAGRRACPPEDCGGASGYARFALMIETGEDPWDEGEDVEELLEWVGEWDPAAFDLETAKRRFDAKAALPRDEFL